MTQTRFAEDKPKIDRGTEPGRLLDLIILTLALDAYTLAGDNDKVSARGITLWRQHKGDLEDATAKHIEPLMESPDMAPAKAKVSLLQSLDPSRKARFYEVFMVVLRKHSSIMRDLFVGRAYGNAQKAAAACEEGDVALRLQKLSLIPTSSGLSAPMKWIDSAAEDAGVAPSPVESAASHAEATQGAVEEMRRVRTALEAADPSSPDTPALQERKEEIDAELQDAINESDNPSATLAAVATSLAQKPKSAVVEEFGLTEEQAAVVASRGRVVVAAGAGSGKTQTSVAWIASLVREQGYAPEQILACSFTRAASSELEARVEGQAGVRGASIGTTHSMARMIIGYAHPELKAQLQSTKMADKCFKIAMKQVELSAEGYAAQKEQNKELLAKIEAIPGWRGIDFLQSLHRQLEQGRTLSEKQIAALSKFRGGGGGGYRRRYAYDDEGTIGVVEEVKVAADEGGGDDRQSQFWKVPAGQWFNIGEKLVDDAGKPVGVKRATLAVENFKNGGISVEDAWQTYGNQPGFLRLMAAVYGAYEWLKKNDPVYGPSMDFTDQLVKALQILQNEPDTLAAMQRRFKVVIVDEAQDLNQIQFDFFNLLGSNADVLAYVGDDKQCVHEDTIIATPNGDTRAGDLLVGDAVTSYRNGEIVVQEVRHTVLSSWDRGFKITTDGGHTLTMSPSHRIWASSPTTDGQDEVAVYLMYRRDMGFRVGITNKGKTDKRGGDYFNSYGGRAFMEKAERMWVLDICPDREAALLKEMQYSLRYAVPTTVFNGEHRGINQARIDSLFDEFGKNGGKLLEDRCLHFDHPHWMSQSYTKHGRDRRTIHLIAHSPSNTQVALEWSGGDLDAALNGQFKRVGERRRIRRWFANYRDALAYATELSRASGANLRESLSTPEERLHLFTASGLFPGMRVAVLDTPDTGIVLETIVSVEPATGKFIDLDVDDASNFFGGEILSHNSIYAFRGAKPGNYVSLTKMPGYQTKGITMNFRSGKHIVDAANRLMKHNEDRQIPMVCEADVARKGMGQIVAKESPDHESAAEQVAQEIKDSVDAGDSPKDFGILVRNNAEADAYTLSLISRGIPYRMLKKSEGGYFGKPLVRALVAWMTLVVSKNDSEINDAVTQAHMTPGFMLDKQFSTGLARNVRGMNYLDYIMAGKPVYFDRVAWRNKNVFGYADAIRGLVASGSAGNSEDLIRAILSVKGSKGTFEDALIKMVDEEDVIEDEGSLEPSAEAIREAAMAPLRPLIAMAKNFTDPATMMQFIAKMKAANEKAQKKTPDEKDDWKEPAVLIGTVHGWKGLQAKHVYICMSGGVFPNFRTDEAAREDPTAYDEERRLAYVAITRGEQSVTVMAPAVTYLGKPATGVSRFISEACITVEGQPKTPDGEPVEEPPEEARTASFVSRLADSLESYSYARP
jgi:DNA helicase-2/ATP-dependent DNA helicase PcrA